MRTKDSETLSTPLPKYHETAQFSFGDLDDQHLVNSDLLLGRRFAKQLDVVLLIVDYPFRAPRNRLQDRLSDFAVDAREDISVTLIAWF
jgi:hypothetical protein